MDEDEYQRVLAVKRRVEATLLAIPGVHGVGIGYKEVQGEPVPQIAIVVHLTHKRPLREVPASEVVPAQIEGIPTDVVEHAPLRHLAGPPPLQPLPDERRQRPLLLGCQLFSPGATQNHIGTAGAIFQVPIITGKTFLLTAGHNFSAEGVNVSQPDDSASSNGNGIGTASNFISTYSAEGGTTVDAGLVVLNSGVTWAAQLVEGGPILGSYNMTPRDLPPPKTKNPPPRSSLVHKYGRTTRYTEGYVAELDLTGTLDNQERYQGLLGIRWQNHIPFSRPGDSGAAIVNADDLMVGLLILGDGQTYSGATPIQAIFDAYWEQYKMQLQLMTGASAPPRPGMERLREVEEEVAPDLEQTATGRTLLAFYRQHAEQLTELAHHNERVRAVWDAIEGRALLTGFYNALQDRSSPVLPIWQGEQPVAEALEQLAQALAAEGSADLVEGLDQIRSVVLEALGKSLPEVLVSLAADEKTVEDQAQA